MDNIVSAILAALLALVGWSLVRLVRDMDRRIKIIELRIDALPCRAHESIMGAVKSDLVMVKTLAEDIDKNVRFLMERLS